MYRTLLYLKGLIIVSLLFSMQMDNSSACPIYTSGPEYSKLVPQGYQQPIHDQELSATEENTSEDTFSEFDFDLESFPFQVQQYFNSNVSLSYWHSDTRSSSLPLYLYHCNFRL